MGLADGLGGYSADRPFLLIEKNVGGDSPPYCLSDHSTADAAATFNISHEYASDWDVVVIVDLRDGTEYDPVITATTIPKEPKP